jgi:uncharacterized membrane protein
MDALVVLVAGALLLTPILVFALLGRVGRVKDEMARLGVAVDRLGARIDRLGWRLEVGEADAPLPGPVPAASAPVAQPEPPPVPAEPAPRVAEPEEVAPAEPEPEIAPAPWIPPRLAKPAEPRPAGLRAESLESAIGQKWLVRIGALVLVVGAGFLYAYAIEQGWIGVVQRAISGAVVGLGVVWLGIFFNRRGFAPLAQGFVACGAGLLFLDIFAAHKLYDLIGASVALPAMAAVTVLVATIALRWSAMPLIILAQIGGFLAPFLVLRPSSDSQVILGHLLIVDAGFLLVAVMRRWKPVEILAAAATPIAFLLATADGPPRHVADAGWACAFGVLFLGLAAVPAIARREGLDRISSVIVTAMAFFTAVQVEFRLSEKAAEPRLLALVLGGLAVLHAAGAEGLVARAGKAVAGAELLRLLAGLLVLDALRFPFGAPATTAAFMAAALGLALVGRQRASLGYRAAAVAGFVLLIARVLDRHLHGAVEAAAAGTPFWNQDFALAAAGVAALAAASFTWRETRWLGLSAAVLFGAVVLSGELAYWITGVVSDPRYASALVTASRCVVLTGMMVGFATAARRTGRWLFVALAVLFALMGLVQLLHLTSLLQRPLQLFLANPACLASLFLPLGLLVAARQLRGEGALDRPLGLGFVVAGAVLPLVTLSVDAYRYFHERFPRGDALVDAGSAAVSVTWALYAAMLLAIGISRRLRPARLGALTLLAATLVKVVMSDLANLDQLARIASFIALGIVLMSGAWAYHRFAARIFGASDEARA